MIADFRRLITLASAMLNLFVVNLIFYSKVSLEPNKEFMDIFMEK